MEAMTNREKAQQTIEALKKRKAAKGKAHTIMMNEVSSFLVTGCMGRNKTYTRYCRNRRASR